MQGVVKWNKLSENYWICFFIIYLFIIFMISEWVSNLEQDLNESEAPPHGEY